MRRFFFRNDDNNTFRSDSLLIMLVAGAVVYWMWQTPALEPILYPFRLFVTYIHEAGHSLAAILTGGSVIGFSVSADGSGVATTAGGARWLIIPAGYLGAALFGAVLFYLTNTVRYTRAIAIVLGIGLIVFTLAFARADRSGVPIALVVGIGFGLLLILMGWRFPRWWNLLVLNVLSLLTALNAVLDVTRLINAPHASGQGRTGAIPNDATAFSEQVFPLIPPAGWALIWSGIAIFLLLIAVYRVLRR